MDFLELARARYSVRHFEKRPIEEETLQKILTAAQLAPTARNKQAQKLFVLRSEEALRKIRRATPYTHNAPVVILIGYDEEAEWKHPMEEGFHSGWMDASIAGTHMMLEAADLGVGSCWVTGFSPSTVRSLFHIPKNIKLCCLLALGYPTEASHPSSKYHEPTKSLDELCSFL